MRQAQVGQHHVHYMGPDLPDEQTLVGLQSNRQVEEIRWRELRCGEWVWYIWTRKTRVVYHMPEAEYFDKGPRHLRPA